MNSASGQREKKAMADLEYGVSLATIYDEAEQSSLCTHVPQRAVVYTCSLFLSR